MLRLTVLVALFGLCFCGPVSTRRYHGFSKNTTEMIEYYGYPYQNYTVQTEDGYQLDLIRIPRGAEGITGQAKNKPVVVILHGLLSSADDFLYGGPSEGLAFYLADKGYDVFLANCRGSFYGQKHTQLNPQHDAAFWRFSFHEIGTKDLKAITDKIIAVTGQEKLNFIGHNQGSTAFLVLNSEYPEYNEKYSRAIMLGPLAYMQHTSSSILRLIAENQHSKSWVLKNLGVNQYNPSKDLLFESEYDCKAQKIDESICKNVYFLLNGYNSQNLNSTTLKEVVHHVPTSTSSKEILHYAQLVKDGRFEKYETEEEYDLSKITTPVTIFTTSNDVLCHESDVTLLKEKLRNAQIEKFEQLTNNLDFLWSKNIQSNVYEKIVEYLQKH